MSPLHSTARQPPRGTQTVRESARGRLRISVTLVVLLVLVPGMVFLDSAIGILGEDATLPGLPVSPGQLVRGAIFALGLIMIGHTLAHRRLVRLRTRLILLLAAAGIGVLSGYLFSPLPTDLLFDLRLMLRVLYGPMLVFFLATLFLRFGVTWPTVLCAVSWYGAAAGALILLLAAAGIGHPTYGEYSSAFAGFFLAPNDTGLAMLVSLAASFHRFWTSKSPLYGALALVTVAGLLVLGTRATLLGCVIVPSAVIALNSGHLFSRPRRWLTAVAMVLVLGSGLVGWNRYRTILEEWDPHQVRRLGQLASPEFNRVGVGAASLSYLSRRPLYTNLIGEGATAYRRGNGAAATGRGPLMAEVDWIDLVGAHGLLFTVLVYAFYGRFFLGRAWVGTTGDPGARTVLLVALLVYVGHASVAGHGITSPTPSGVVVPLLAYVAAFRGSPGG